MMVHRYSDLNNKSIQIKEKICLNEPVYSGKQVLIDEKRNFSANKSFLFKNNIIPA
jgi:hypothetical protein